MEGSLSELTGETTRRILAIDGGGIKGVFPAAFLAEIESQIGEPIVDYFDLIAGTSTGGIIALALGLGLRGKEILELYEKNARRIFPHVTGFSLPGIFRAKYAKATLPQVLTEAFGQRLLGESCTRLIIPSLIWRPSTYISTRRRTTARSSGITKSLLSKWRSRPSPLPRISRYTCHRRGFRLLTGASGPATR